jgi:hypothetical protein
MKLLRKSMILMCMLVGVYFVAADVAAASASPSCFQGCVIIHNACLYDYDCYENPNNIGCNFCENRLNNCLVGCQIRPGHGPVPR